MLKQKLKLRLQSFTFFNQSLEIKKKKNDLICLEEQLEYNYQKTIFIQSKFDFTVPSYIINEIIEKEHYANHSNLISLINLAVVSGKISKENAESIKKIYY